MTVLLGISGSLRAGSHNRKLVAEAGRVFAPDSFVVGDIGLPLYDGDVEAQGFPDAVERLAAQVRAADAVVISTPEYNKALSGALKNALDWLSRVKPGRHLAGQAGGDHFGDRRPRGRRTGGRYSLRLCLNPFRPARPAGAGTAGRRGRARVRRGGAVVGGLSGGAGRTDGGLAGRDQRLAPDGRAGRPRAGARRGCGQGRHVAGLRPGHCGPPAL